MNRPTYKNIFQLLLCTLLLLIPYFSHATAAPIDSYRMRAIVLSRILPSVQWPDNSFTNKDTPIILGVIGLDSEKYATAFKQATTSLKINGRRVEIIKLPNPQEIRSHETADFRKILNRCHIIYFTSDMQKEYHRIFKQLQQTTILTVGEEKLFCRFNGMICLDIEKKRLKIIINTLQVQKGGLKISAEVLRHATIIK